MGSDDIKFFLTALVKVGLATVVGFGVFVALPMYIF